MEVDVLELVDVTSSMPSTFLRCEWALINDHGTPNGSEYLQVRDSRQAPGNKRRHYPELDPTQRLVQRRTWPSAVMSWRRGP